jgi:hypothetical protein
MTRCVCMCVYVCVCVRVRAWCLRECVRALRARVADLVALCTDMHVRVCVTCLRARARATRVPRKVI